MIDLAKAFEAVDSNTTINSNETTDSNTSIDLKKAFNEVDNTVGKETLASTLGIGPKDTLPPKKNLNEEETRANLGNPEYTTDELIDQNKKSLQGAAIGATNIAGGIGEVAVDDVFGTDYFKSYNKEKQKFIKDNGLEAEEMLGEGLTLGSGSSVALAKKAAPLLVAAIDGVSQAFAAKGRKATSEDAIAEGVLTSTLSYVPVKIIDKLVTGLRSGLTKQADLIVKLSQGRIDVNTALSRMKDVPPEEQILSLAESEDIAKNYIKHAVGDDSELAIKYGGRLESRHNAIRQFVANDADMAAAKAKYSNVSEALNNPELPTLNTSNMSELLDKVFKVFKTDPSGLGTSIRTIKEDLDTDSLKLGDALNIRENINAILRKPAISKSYKSSNMLNNVKELLDKKIDNSLAAHPELRSMKDDAINTYRETINNYKLGEILDKHTKADFATDWKAVRKDIEKEKLGSHYINNYVLPLLQQFQTKFKNDKYMSSVITPKGNPVGGLLGLWSKIIQTSLDLASPLYNKSRYMDKQIRNAITKAIKKSSNDPASFIEALYEGQNQDILRLSKEEFAHKVGGTIDEDGKVILQIPYNPDLKPTGDVNVAPIYTTEKGTAGTANEISQIALHDATTELLQKSLGEPKQVNKVTEHLDKIGFFKPQFKRYEDIINSTANKLKVDERKANITRVTNMIRNEANALIKEVEKSTGVKLSPEDTQKIVKYKFDEMMKK